MDFNEIQPNRELRACARGQLHGVWGQMALTYFIYFLIYTPYYFISILTSIIDSVKKYDFLAIPFYVIQDALGIDMSDIEIIFPVLNIILSLAAGIVVGPFVLGFTGYFLKRVRGEEIATKNIFDGFKRFAKGFWLQFFINFFTSLWTLLFIIPGIVKALSYSMAFYIMYDNPGIESLEAIKRSQIMMKGYKFKLFLLYLSFIGWMLLASLSFGIGYLWLRPYVGLSTANFYENLKRNQENKAAETQTAKTPIDPFLST